VFAQDVGYTFSSHRDDSSVLSIADPKEWFFLPANNLDWISVSQCLYELSGTAALAPRRVGKPGRSPLHLHRVEKLAVCCRYLITPFCSNTHFAVYHVLVEHSGWNTWSLLDHYYSALYFSKPRRRSVGNLKSICRALSFFKVKFEPEVRPSMRLFPLKSARMILQVIEKADSRRQCLYPSRFHVSGSDRRRSNGSSLVCYYVLWFSTV
jgi:hypothetical protein